MGREGGREGKGESFVMNGFMNGPIHLLAKIEKQIPNLQSIF